MKLFVTGTDTDVGKTYISAMLVKSLGARYWKPIQCGTPLDRDCMPQHCSFEETYAFEAPISPHAAAEKEHVKIQLSSFVMPKADHLIVEGAGGALVPLNEQEFLIDLIRYLDLPALVVAKNRVGAINHTLLTIRALKEASIPIVGVVLNGGENAVNKEAVERYGKVKVLAEVPYDMASIYANGLARRVSESCSC